MVCADAHRDGALLVSGVVYSQLGMTQFLMSHTAFQMHRVCKLLILNEFGNFKHFSIPARPEIHRQNSDEKIRYICIFRLLQHLKCCILCPGSKTDFA